MLWPLLIGISCILIIILVVIPQLLTYLQIRTQLSQTENRLGILQAKAQDLEQIDDATYLKNLQAAFVALPQDKDVPQALVVLQDMVTRSGLALENIKFISGDTTGKDSQTSFQLGVTVAGSMDSLRRFLVMTQESPRLLKVVMISAEAVGNSNIAETTLVLDVYYQPISTNLGAVDQPLPHLSDADKKLLTELLAKYQSNSGVTGVSIPLGKQNPFN